MKVVYPHKELKRARNRVLFRLDEAIRKSLEAGSIRSLRGRADEQIRDRLFDNWTAWYVDMTYLWAKGKVYG